jgi:O-antigen/teichoic acid export membrane protein
MMVGKSSYLGRKLLSGSALRVANLIAAALASFFLMPFIVHHLGDRIYGFWSLATVFVGYYNLLDLGLSSAVSQYMCIAIGRNDEVECGVVFNTALRLQSVVGGVALLATAAIATATPWLAQNASDAHVFRKVIIILGVNAALSFPARVYWAVLEAELRFDIQSWLANLGLALRTGLVVWVILAGGGLLALAQVTLFVTLAVTALQIWLARRQAPWARIENRSIQSKLAKSFFSYSVYTFVAYLADIVRFQIDPLVISGLIGLAAVTHYKVAGVLTQYYLQVIVISVGMLLPVLSRLHGAGNWTGIEEVFFFGTKLSVCISVFICFALIAWGRPFIGRWMGPGYEDGYLPLVMLSLAVLLDSCQKSSADLLYATFKHRFYAVINCTEGILNLAFSLALARPLGIKGVAMGTLIGAFIVRITLQPWWVCKVSGLAYPNYMKFLGGNLVRSACVASVAIAAVVWGLRPHYGWLITSALCATTLYAAGSWLFIFNRREQEQLLAALRGTANPRDMEIAAAAAPIE